MMREPFDCHDDRLVSPPSRPQAPAQERYRTKPKHPWRSDVVMQRNVKTGRQHKPPKRSSQLSRTNFKQLLQQRKHVYSSPSVVVLEEEDDVCSLENSTSQHSYQYDEVSLGGAAHLSPQPAGYRLSSPHRSPLSANQEYADDYEIVQKRNSERALKQDLEQRLRLVSTDHYHCVEAYGGQSPVSSSFTNQEEENRRVATKIRLHQALQERLSLIYTGDYHSVEAYGMWQQEPSDAVVAAADVVKGKSPPIQRRRARTPPLLPSRRTAAVVREKQTVAADLDMPKMTLNESTSSESLPKQDKNFFALRRQALAVSEEKEDDQPQRGVSTVYSPIVTKAKPEEPNPGEQVESNVAKVQELVADGRHALQALQEEDSKSSDSDTSSSYGRNEQEEVCNDEQKNDGCQPEGDEEEEESVTSCSSDQGVIAEMFTGPDDDQYQSAEEEDNEDESETYHSAEDDEDNQTMYTEYTVQETVSTAAVPCSTAAIESSQDNHAANETQCMVNNTEASTVDRSFMMPGPIGLQGESNLHEGHAEWDEYTVEETIVEEGNSQQHEEWDEYTVDETVVDDPGLMMPGPISNEPMEDTEWDEYTVDETVAEAPIIGSDRGLMMPGPISNETAGDGEWDEYTVDETVTEDSIVAGSRALMMPGPIKNMSETVDGSEWDEYTVEESVMEESACKESSAYNDSVDPTVKTQDENGIDDEEEEIPEEDAPYITINRSFSSRDDHVPSDDFTTCTELTEDLGFGGSYLNNNTLPGYFENNSGGEEELTKKQTQNDETETTVDVTAGSDGDSSAEEATGIRSACSSSTRRSSAGSSRSGSMEPSRIKDILRREVWSPNSSVVETALQDLSEEASSAENRAVIIKFGGILAILRAMEVNLQHAGIQGAACFALEKLAVDHEAKLAICQVGGVQAIAISMEEHLDDIFVQHTACSALCAVTNHDNASEIEAEGAIEAISSSMAKHTEHPVVQEKAFGALANLCIDNQESLKTLSLAGGLVAMTTALQKPWKNASAKQEGISTLSMLLRVLAQSD